MNKKHIQDLLDKYFEGETSLKEEKELRDFFRTTTLLPEEWHTYKQIFAFFESEGQKKMSPQKNTQKKKNIIWLFATTISLAATVLILLTIFIPSTRTQLQPLVIATKQLDTFYAKKDQTRKSETTKPVKSESKKKDNNKSVPIRKILDDDSSTLLASNKEPKNQEISIATTINDALTPLGKMQDIKEAMDKFKYFDLMNKYLPEQDISSIIRNNK